MQTEKNVIIIGGAFPYWYVADAEDVQDASIIGNGERNCAIVETTTRHRNAPPGSRFTV